MFTRPISGEPALSALQRCQDLHGKGRYSEALALARQCLAAPGADDDLRWRSLTAIGNLCRAMEMFAESLDAHTTALTLARDAGNAAHVAMSWNNLGVNFLNASAWDLAIECFSRVTEDPLLATVRPPYNPHGNLAICHLHLENIQDGLLEVRQAFRLETEELRAKNTHCPILYRHTFVQLGLQSNRVSSDEMEQYAREAAALASTHPEARSKILVRVMTAALKVAYGDRDAGIEELKGLLPAARECPQVLSDVLFALVQAERLAGRPGNAVAYLCEWANHLFPEGPQQAARLGLASWLEPGATLREQLEEIVIPPPLPPAFKKLLTLP